MNAWYVQKKALHLQGFRFYQIVNAFYRIGENKRRLIQHLLNNFRTHRHFDSAIGLITIKQYVTA